MFLSSLTAVSCFPFSPMVSCSIPPSRSGNSNSSPATDRVDEWPQHSTHKRLRLESRSSTVA